MKCDLNGFRLGVLLLAVAEFKTSNDVIAAGASKATTGLNFVPGHLSKIYQKAGYVDAKLWKGLWLRSDTAIVEAIEDEVHRCAMIKVVYTVSRNLTVQIGAPDSLPDDLASAATTPAKFPDEDMLTSSGTRVPRAKRASERLNPYDVLQRVARFVGVLR